MKVTVKNVELIGVEGYGYGDQLVQITLQIEAPDGAIYNTQVYAKVTDNDYSVCAQTVYEAVRDER